MQSLNSSPSATLAADEVWTLDVWHLLAFDGRIGSGRSFLADLDTKQIVSVRDFSVRTG